MKVLNNMNSIKCISTLLFVLFSSIVFSQTTLIGKVTNNKSEPIVNAIVYLDSIQTNSTTNSIGFFKCIVGKCAKNKGSATSAIRVLDTHEPAQK